MWWLVPSNLILPQVLIASHASSRTCSLGRILSWVHSPERTPNSASFTSVYAHCRISPPKPFQDIQQFTADYFPHFHRKNVKTVKQTFRTSHPLPPPWGSNVFFLIISHNTFHRQNSDLVALVLLPPPRDSIQYGLLPRFAGAPPGVLPSISVHLIPTFFYDPISFRT